MFRSAYKSAQRCERAENKYHRNGLALKLLSYVKHGLTHSRAADCKLVVRYVVQALISKMGMRGTFNSKGLCETGTAT